ncbi:trichohyalin [Drosophila rhopaloa]|uniref:Trichohyalin n=1 Tax=Drosophila rhopaloa TaxID=1041015 RepID=A0ABM5HJM5_DRORH|nr:trichohyalin [Drosophila rhopaloa]
MENINKRELVKRRKRRSMRDRLDRSYRQKRQSSPPQLVAPKPSSSSLARRRSKTSPFEWRKRVKHLDYLEDQYRREEQEMWSLEFPSEECPKLEPPPIICKPKNRAKTVGVQVDVPVLSPRAKRDLCGRERKQREILERRERERVEKLIREQERDRQRTLLAKQLQLDRQRLEKARQLRDRRLREQQQKVKERRDYERYLMFKKREEQRLRDQRWRARRRPSTPSSQNVEVVEEVGTDLGEDLRHMSRTAMTVPADSEDTQSTRREQQLHLRAENVRHKVLAYEQLKEFHRERARSGRYRQLRMRETPEEKAKKQEKEEKKQRYQENKKLERKHSEKLKSELEEMKDFQRKACEQEEIKIERLKMKLNEVRERERRRNEEMKLISQRTKELEKREREECERIAKEEKFQREKGLLEKLKRNRSEKDELEKKAREEDLKREQFLKQWLQMQDKEREEREEREERQKRVIPEGEMKTQNTVDMGDQANELRKEELDLMERENLLKERQGMTKLEEVKARDQRLQKIRQIRERELQVEFETREVAKQLKEQLERQLELHTNREMGQKPLEETAFPKLEDLETEEKILVTESQNFEDKAPHGTQISEDRTKSIESETKRKSQPNDMEKYPGDMNTQHGSSSKDILSASHTKVQQFCQQAEPQAEGNQERDGKLNDQVLERRQVLEELRLEAGKLADQHSLARRCRRKESFEIQDENIKNAVTEPYPSEEVVDENWSCMLTQDKQTADKTRQPKIQRLSSSREYFQPGSPQTRSERWSRFIGSERESESEDLGGRGRNRVSSSSGENDAQKAPRYSLVGSYCPSKKIYTVEAQNIQPTPYGNTEQQEAYGSYVRNRVANWRKSLRPNSYSTDEEEIVERRERNGGKSYNVGLTFCTQTGKKRYPQNKQRQFKQREGQVQQRRVFGQLLTEARSSDYHQEILNGENCLLQQKLSEGQTKATNNYVQEALLQAACRIISLLKNDQAFASSEEEFETPEDGLPEQIHRQETESKIKLPRPIFKTLMEPLLPLTLPHLFEKFVMLDNELEAHLRKLSIRVFGGQGGKDMRREVERMMDQQRQVQSIHLAKMCRDSEEQTLRQWRRLARNSLLGLNNIFKDYCDMRDALPCVTLQTIERLYSEWKVRRFTVD